MLILPPKIEYVIETLQKNGYEAYAVGGCVRDMLTGKTPHDFDITTEALPEDIIRIFEKTVPTGIKHGTVTVISGGVPVETTTYRTEGKYTDHRRPESVSFVKNLREDLSRRDFTVNAMAYNSKDGLKDYFSGREDIEKKILRAVGDPQKRFYEDYGKTACVNSPDCKLFTFLYSGKADVLKTLEYLKAPTKTKKFARDMLSLLKLPFPSDKAEIKEMLFFTSPLLVGEYLDFKAAYGEDAQNARLLLKEIIENNEPYKISDLKITGGDLIKLGLSGEAVGETLERLRRLAAHDPTVNTRKKLLRAALK